MCSDFTDLSGEASAAAREHLGEDLAPEHAVVADVEVLPLDHAVRHLGEVEAGDELVEPERHQRSLVRSSAPGDRAAAVGDRRDLDVLRHLALAGLAAELEARLVDEAEAVEPAGRELAAVGVERAARPRGRSAARPR